MPSEPSTVTSLFVRVPRAPRARSRHRCLAKHARENHELLPGIAQAREVRGDALASPEDLALDGHHRRRPFEVRGRELGEGIDVAPIEGIDRSRPELTANALRDWCRSQGPAAHTSTRARPGRTPTSSPGPRVRDDRRKQRAEPAARDSARRDSQPSAQPKTSIILFALSVSSSPTSKHVLVNPAPASDNSTASTNVPLSSRYFFNTG
jgi:hypothetical protein